MTIIINQSLSTNIPIVFHSQHSQVFSPLTRFFAEAQDRQIPHRRWHGHDVDAANLLGPELTAADGDGNWEKTNLSGAVSRREWGFMIHPIAIFIIIAATRDYGSQ